jgi:hypothetical protein
MPPHSGVMVRAGLEHRAEKWEPVFGKSDAQTIK